MRVIVALICTLGATEFCASLTEVEVAGIARLPRTLESGVLVVIPVRDFPAIVQAFL